MGNKKEDLYEDYEMEKARERPKLHCSECGDPVTLTATRGMIGEGYFVCKGCDSMFISHALTEWWELGVETGEKSVQSKIKKALGL